MAQLCTPAEAAEILNIRESWLRHKAAARAIPCTFVGKHLRFTEPAASNRPDRHLYHSQDPAGDRPAKEQGEIWRMQKNAARGRNRGG